MARMLACFAKLYPTLLSQYCFVKTNLESKDAGISDLHTRLDRSGQLLRPISRNIRMLESYLNEYECTNSGPQARPGMASSQVFDEWQLHFCALLAFHTSVNRTLSERRA